MKAIKKVCILIAALLSFLVVNCNRDDAIGTETPEQEENKGRVISLTASMPNEGEEDTPTRVALSQDNLNIKLSWEVGDKIYLVFAEGNVVKGKQIVILTADDITNSGEKASFNITVPDEITGESFDLFGVHGGSGFAGDGSYELILPGTPWSGRNLEEIQHSNLVMLKFAKTGISKANPSVSVNFSHLGSLFHIRLRNTSDVLLNGITKAELISSTAIGAHQNSSSATYNPVTGEFTGTSISATSMTFDITPTSLGSGNTLDFWGWFIPLANNRWPWLGLKVTHGGTQTVTSVNKKPMRGTATAKAFHLYASYDGTSLAFTNSAGTVDAYKFTDVRDNTEYKIVTIGDQVWMAENLKYLPQIHAADNGSSDEARYYVYNYTLGDVEGAKATANYTTYGVLYNWPAAMAGATSSDANPSSIKGICPTGWHLPSDAEWKQLEMFLGMTQEQADATGYRGEKNEGEQLKNSGTTYWANGNTGTNASGFTAFPGGYRPSDGSFSGMGYLGFFWSATINGSSAWYRYLQLTNSKVSRSSSIKTYGLSVRCLRN